MRIYAIRKLLLISLICLSWELSANIGSLRSSENQQGKADFTTFSKNINRAEFLYDIKNTNRVKDTNVTWYYPQSYDENTFLTLMKPDDTRIWSNNFKQIDLPDNTAIYLPDFWAGPITFSGSLVAGFKTGGSILIPRVSKQIINENPNDKDNIFKNNILYKSGLFQYIDSSISSTLWLVGFAYLVGLIIFSTISHRLHKS